MQRKQLLIIFVFVEELKKPTVKVTLAARSYAVVNQVAAFLLNSNALNQGQYVTNIFITIDMVTVLRPTPSTSSVQTLTTMCMIQLSLVRSLQFAAMEQLPFCKTVNIFALVRVNCFVIRVPITNVYLVKLPVRNLIRKLSAYQNTLIESENLEQFKCNFNNNIYFILSTYFMVINFHIVVLHI